MRSAPPARQRDPRDAARRLAQSALGGQPDAEALNQLETMDPGDLAETLAAQHDRLAFWINIYNGSVRARMVEDPGRYTSRIRFFAGAAVTVAGRRLSLNAIEHGLIRRSAFALGLGYLRNPWPSRFERRLRVDRLDPRIHFALNCGALSCPRLRVYDGAELEPQLDAAARDFLRSETRFDGEVLRVSRILLWYQGDFGGRAGILELLREHGVIPPDVRPRLRFNPYDWSPVPLD